MASAGKVISGLFYVIFGIVWMSMASSMPSVMGVPFMLVGLLIILAGLYNIARRGKEKGPQRPAAGGPVHGEPETEVPRSDVVPDIRGGDSNGYCPYCGSPLQRGFLYCGVCGRRLRWRGSGGSSGS